MSTAMFVPQLSLSTDQSIFLRIHSWSSIQLCMHPLLYLHAYSRQVKKTVFHRSPLLPRKAALRCPRKARTSLHVSIYLCIYLSIYLSVYLYTTYIDTHRIEPSALFCHHSSHACPWPQERQAVATSQSLAGRAPRRGARAQRHHLQFRRLSILAILGFILGILYRGL